MPFVICPLLVIGAIHHIATVGWDWMDVAWLTVGIGGLVFCIGLEVYSVHATRKHSRQRIRLLRASAGAEGASGGGEG